MNGARYPCPCCGWRVFSEPPGSYEICPVCGWEDDLSQLRFAAQGGGANDLSLVEAQARFARRAPLAAAPSGLTRDPTWRPIDPGRDAIERSEPGVDYGLTYAADPSDYYYWRRRGSEQ